VGRSFDYLVPERLAGEVDVGTIVRVDLHGRRVRGWVVEVGTDPPPGVVLKPIARVTRAGPPADVIELARWAAWRWAGHPSALLGTASPRTAVPARFTRSTANGAPQRDNFGGSGSGERIVVQLPPAADPAPHVLAAAEAGPALIVCPSVGTARWAADVIRRAGAPVAVYPDGWAAAAAGGACVVGARAAAWAPMPDLAAVVVLDEHDEVHQEERTPTWNARDVAIERAARARVPCVLLSPCPSLEARSLGPVRRPSTTEERAGWPVIDVIDRRRDDIGRSGLYSDRLVARLRERERGQAVCVLNRKGRSRLLACVACGAIARCDRCGAAVVLPEPGRLVCPRCSQERPQVCASCGGTAMKNLRLGVSRVREELEALLGEPVAEITGSGPAGPAAARVVVGTEAVLHQTAGPVGVVAFLDLDQELLAPRYRAGEQAMALLARAARLLGGRATGGRLVVQTRTPSHPVVQAALHADPDRWADDERARRQELGYPPYSALAAVSGAAAPAFVDNLGHPLGIEILGPADGRWLLRAADHGTLCDALAATARPPGRMRLEVDPLRV
jgi:primosomal protein N' (replication factor Y)